MATFVILIEAAGYWTVETAATYPNMFMAMADTLRSASTIALERSAIVGFEPRVVCEIIDLQSRERREMVVQFDTSVGAMALTTQEYCGTLPHPPPWPSSVP